MMKIFDWDRGRKRWARYCRQHPECCGNPAALLAGLPDDGTPEDNHWPQLAAILAARPGEEAQG